MSSDSVYNGEALPALSLARPIGAAWQRLRARLELLGLVGIAGVLNLWGLSVNGWANTYYSAAVRSISTSWHDFLFASLDKTGLMTVDKPPLSLWMQALAARVFGFHPLSVLIPQALMGIAATVLIYDLTRRRFGRAAGFVAGFALATTPVVVAVSRHNNPDELLVLCCVAALWCALRALDTARTTWLVWTGVLIGLGFETKMAVALMVVPGIAAAYLWVAPRGRLTALRQLLTGGVALAVVALAWPLLVTLTPAADRPWISGTADNSIWSLIFNYNGAGRIAGQSGGPGALGGAGGGPGGVFGGATGIFRLLQTSLGDQAGWLLGFAVLAGLALLGLSRLRRADPRTGWLIAVGGAFVTTAVVFSFASGIFHPYYVSLLAPFTAALIGAGIAVALSGGRAARIFAPVAVAAGAVTELVVLGTLDGELSWVKPLIIVVAAVCAIALALKLTARLRGIVVAVALAALFAAPATWAAQTLRHAASATFPAGGPATASAGGPPGFGGHGAFGLPGGRGAFGLPRGRGAPAGATGRQAFAGPPPEAARASRVPRAFSPPGPGAPGGGGFGGAVGARVGPGGGFGATGTSLNAAITHAHAHGGGAIGVSSQSSAAAAILSSDANVAGLGGFSGRESSVTGSWVAMQVRSGRLRWVIVDNQNGGRVPGDPRRGSQSAMDVVAKTCKPVTIKTSTAASIKMYDCQGRAAAIAAASGKS